MLHQRQIVVVLAIVGCTGLGCSSDSPRSEPDAQFEKNKGLFATLTGADRMTLYEGLPHQTYEEELLAEEKKNKETVDLHDFPFYRQTLVLKEADAERLRGLVGDPQSFRPFKGLKGCGGFHPDFCLEWSAGGTVYRCLICFGCGEVMVYSRGSKFLCDMQADTHKQLKESLIPLRKNRPESEYYKQRLMRPRD